MPASYQTFTSLRATDPDVPSLAAALAVVDPTARAQFGPRWTGTLVVKKSTPWTAPEVAAAQTALDSCPAPSAALRYARTSRDKDVLTTMAMIVRARGIPAWTALTTPEKVAAALAEADVWAQLRNFVETNL